MASPNDTAMQDGDIASSKQPFTVEENIHQLNAIDKQIVQLMKHTSTALNSLTTPALDEEDATKETQSQLDSAAQKATFRSATDSFLTTLHNVDVLMKRQIMSLEEAGIVNLSGAARQEPGAAVKASLKPNGTGAIGNLDVGWLNSRSTRVERDMEAELWSRAKGLLQKEEDQMRVN